MAFFGDQLSEVTTEPFCGSEYRTNGITAAILREQLKRLDGILADLRKNKKYLMDALADVCAFVPSNDPEGDCATTVAFAFDSAQEARAFSEAEGVRGTVPINTGKHVYTNWTPIMNKRGALHPLMDPFKMEANKDILPDYRADMCKQTLDLLSRAVYISVYPDWTRETMDARISCIRKALGK